VDAQGRDAPQARVPASAEPNVLDNHTGRGITVTKDDRPSRMPLLLGNDFGDEDEETALAIARPSSSTSLHSDDAGTAGDNDRGKFDDDDETEIFRPLPARADAPATAPRASGVVPLDAGGQRLRADKPTAAPAARVLAPLGGEDDEDAETVQLSRPMIRATGGSPTDSGTAPRVRSLDDLPHPEIASDVAADPTLSRPRVVRMTFSPANSRSPAESRADVTDTRRRAAVGAEPGSNEEEEEEEAGTLHIDAPPDATIFVDGVERGHGSVTVEDADRHRRFAVRVHRPGCRPWSRSVSLRGAAELRVAATPEPR